MAEEPHYERGRPAGDDPGGYNPGAGSAPATAGASFESELSRRVSAILDALDREAAAIRRQAREDARRYMSYSRRRADGLVAERQRRISLLSDALVERSERLLGQLEAAERARDAFEDVVGALGETAERLAHDAGDYSEFVAPPLSEAGAEPPAAAPAAEPAREPGIASQDWRDLDGAQVVAIQMAASGSSRAEVEAHIRETLHVGDPVPILDDVFGPGSAADARVPWAKPGAA